MCIRDSIETVEFTIPTTSLTVGGGGGNDMVILSGSLQLPGVILLVSAEQIQVAALANVDTTGGTTDGSITLAATDTQSGTAILGVLAPTASAQLSINNAV